MIALLRGVVCCALLCASFLGVASAGWDVETLMASLARAPAGEVAFRETKHLSALKTPLETRGILRYRPPAYMEKEVFAPYAERMIVDGDRLRLERAGSEMRNVSLDSVPGMRPVIESMRATLKGDLTTLRRFYRVELRGDETAWQLHLLPSDPEAAQLIQVVRIDGKFARLTQIEVRETGGDRSILRLESP